MKLKLSGAARNRLLAAACAGITVSASTPAFAQSSVTLYGLLDEGLTRSFSGHGVTLPGGTVPGPSRGSVSSLDAGIGFGSRVGFRGVEDLGGGLRSIFSAEMGFAADTGAITQGGLAFGRQIFTGLSGSNWTLTAGRHYSLMNIAVGTTEVLGGGYWGNIAGPAMGTAESVGSPAGNGTFQLNTRVDNSILISGRGGAVTGNVMFGLGNENTRHTGRSAQASLIYEDGALRAVTAYARMRQNAEQIIATADPEWLTQWMAGGSYDLKAAKLYGGYFHATGPKNAANLAPVATVGAAGASPFAITWEKHQLFWVGVRVPINQQALSLSLGRSAYDNRGTAPDGHSTTFGATYEYFLSKRTTLYATYGQVNNDAGARTALYSAIPTILPTGFGSDPKALSIGLTHRF